MLFVKAGTQEGVVVDTAPRKAHRKRTVDDVETMTGYAMVLMSKAGLSVGDIAAVAKSLAEGATSKTQIFERLKEAQKRTTEWDSTGNACGLYEPNLLPRYGVQPFTPVTECEHIHPYGEVPSGTSDYCERCSKTGREGLPVFQKNARDRRGKTDWPTPSMTKWEGEQDGLQGGRA